MQKKQLCEIFTQKVMEFINDGYVITPDSMRGSDGTARVDLVKGDRFIRIFLDRKSDYTFNECITLNVGEYRLNDKLSKTIYSKDIIWKNDLTIVETTKFYEVGRKNKWYFTEDEAKEVKQKIAQRQEYKYRYAFGNYDDIVMSERAKEIIMPFVHRQPRCKSAKKKDVTVYKRIYRDGEVKYLISIKGHGYALR